MLTKLDLPTPDGTAAGAWECSSCGGRAATFPVLRRLLLGDFVNGLWRVAANAPFGPVRCPGCRQGLRAVSPIGSPNPIGVCRPCQLAWFEPGAFATCPPLRAATPAPAPAPPPLPPEAAREVAVAQAKELARTYRDRDDGSPPDQWWKTVLGTLGMPVEVDAPELVTRPIATWTTAALMALVTLATLASLNVAVRAGGFVPADPFRHGGLTFISAFFLHAGLVHLLGNAYFLLIFGDNVEDVLGWRRFVMLLVASTVGGDLVHALFDPHASQPCVGASGGISGVMAFYACAFPKARLAVCIRFWWWLRIPAWGAFAVWVLMQSLGVAQQVLGLSHVSSLAHLGGAAVGIGAWWWWWRQGQQPAAVTGSQRQP